MGKISTVATYVDDVKIGEGTPGSHQAVMSGQVMFGEVVG
jgi:hypothetical protein